MIETGSDPGPPLMTVGDEGTELAERGVFFEVIGFEGSIEKGKSEFKFAKASGSDGKTID